MNALLLNAVTGQFAEWRYYQVIMKVRNIVEVLSYTEESGEVKPVHRIRTVDEVNEIYSQKSINDKLQRVFDKERLAPIKNYLTKQPDKYINNLTVAIYGGQPEWFPIGLRPLMRDEGVTYDEEEVEELAKNFGIIKLTGDEILFVLDGQHRIKGLREAIKEDELLGDYEIAITLISHDASLKEKTRRLFTTINRYAKSVSLGESILLDEDDLSAILVRDLIEKYPLFSGRDVIALNKTPNLPPKDFATKLTTAISLYNINEILLENEKLYPKLEGGRKKDIVRVRPTDDIIEKNREVIFAFWDAYFKSFPKAVSLVEGDKSIGLSRKNGGPYYLRPFGQEALAELYNRLMRNKSINEFKKIAGVEEEINSDVWHYIFWNPITDRVMNNKNIIKYYLFYQTGLPLIKKDLTSLQKHYRKMVDSEEADLPKNNNHITGI